MKSAVSVLDGEEEGLDGKGTDAGDEALRLAFETWTRENRQEFRNETKEKFTTEDGLEVKRLYTPLDLAEQGFDYLKDLSFPGAYPYTRAITPTLYRGGLWRISQYSGYATAEESNDLWKAQIKSGLNTVYIAYDLPTQLVYDPDDPRAEGEVGRVGVSLVSLKDWERAFDGIDIEDVLVSQVLNAPGPIGIAMHLALARKRGVPWDRLKGVAQNDVLKEYIARGNYIFPPEPALRLIVDSLAFCAEQVPNYFPITVCTYHFSEQGADRVHEMAFAIADAITYLEAVRERGIDLDLICPRIMWLTSHEHNDFFHQIAKLRAFRKVWARITTERLGVKKPESALCRLYSAEGGANLCKEQHTNNVARISIAALAAALAGVQTIDLRTYDEQWGIPSKEAELLNMRIQQIVAHETGVAQTVDPLGGSYYVESLTLQFEKEILEEVARIDAMGGMLRAIQAGYPQTKNFDNACRLQREIESGEVVRVGFNSFRQETDGNALRVYRAKPEVEQNRIAEVQEFRRNRDNAEVERKLAAVRQAAAMPPAESGNLMPYLIEAVEAFATVGEICEALRQVWGEFREPVVV
jgi:methylmalonyl-CoA mutase N-terminal domain/subunit